jgi:hypothetical protein
MWVSAKRKLPKWHETVQKCHITGQNFPTLKAKHFLLAISSSHANVAHIFDSSDKRPVRF